ncbi:EGF receptor activation regulator Star isoform X2 [Lycorma delicatula]
MDDPLLVAKLRNNYLFPPPNRSSTHIHRYHLNSPEVIDTSMGQAERIRILLNNKRNGFFVECGALDGEIRSNTLYFERYNNWTGLLIEADPLNYNDMIKKNRRAWLSPTCLSVHSYPEIVSFEQHSNMGKISEFKAGERRAGHVDVQCFPFYTYMIALNVTYVDYFSLDVEGVELDVLETIPFDKVHIQTLSVEFAHVKRGREEILQFMSGKGYRLHDTVTHPDWLANDFIFVKE